MNDFEVESAIPTIEVSAPVFTPEFETGLRESIRFQMDNPVDMSPGNISPSLTETDIKFLGYGVVQQHKADLVGITPERAHRWFEIVSEEVGDQEDRFLGPVEDKEWERFEKHEIGGHFSKAVELGCVPEDMTLGIHFGKRLDSEGNPTGKLEFEIDVDIGSSDYIKMDNVDRAAVMLAPEDPSFYDLKRFQDYFEEGTSSFIKRPKEALRLLNKFRTITKATTPEMYQYIKKVLDNELKRKH